MHASGPRPDQVAVQTSLAAIFVSLELSRSRGRFCTAQPKLATLSLKGLNLPQSFNPCSPIRRRLRWPVERQLYTSQPSNPAPTRC